MADAFLHDATQARGERRDARVEVLGVREHEHVRRQPLAMLAQEFGQVVKIDGLEKMPRVGQESDERASRDDAPE